MLLAVTCIRSIGKMDQTANETHKGGIAGYVPTWALATIILVMLIGVSVFGYFADEYKKSKKLMMKWESKNGEQVQQLEDDSDSDDEPVPSHSVQTEAFGDPVPVIISPAQ